MISRLIKAAVLAVVLAAIVQSLPLVGGQRVGVA